MIRRRLLYLSILVLAGALTACDGKDCTDLPDPTEREERFLERVEGYLDDADATDTQEKRILALARGLTPVRAAMQARYEPNRTAILDQMLAEKPNVKVIDARVDDAADAMLTYADSVVDAAMKAHAVLDKKQRGELADELAEPPDPFELDWKADAAVEVFLVDISATSAQKAMIRDELVTVEQQVRKVQKKQHDVRLKILPHVRSDSPRPAEIKALVRKGGTYSVALIQGMARTYVKLMGNLGDKQRKQAKKRLNALKRCPAS